MTPLVFFLFPLGCAVETEVKAVLGNLPDNVKAGQKQVPKLVVIVHLGKSTGISDDGDFGSVCVSPWSIGAGAACSGAEP
jgi:hypothetical protein